MLDITDKDYRLLTDYILKSYGIKLGDSKRSLVVGRLQNILLQNGFNSFSEYINHVFSDPTGNAMSELMSKITTNHTYFMREPEHFYYFKDHILPQLLNTVNGKDLRIWSAGCSTGEEPYTIAMILQDYLADAQLHWDTRILATDISSRALEIAKKGEYMKKDVNALPFHWGANYFNKVDDEKWATSKMIRNEVIFRLFNLNNSNFPFKRKFHVIFCRNVMIYFDASAKIKLVKRFYDFLEDGGYLLIGHSESLSTDKTRFKYVIPAVYRKEHTFI